MTVLNGRIAGQIADKLAQSGYPTCVPEDVFDVYQTGAVVAGTTSDEYDENLTDQIIDQLDSYGIQVP